MKTLVLGTLTLAGLTLAAAGCGSSNNNNNGAGILYRVTWVCPSQADSITFTATDTGTNQSLAPDTFSCADGTADILYDPGSYDIDVEPTGAAGDFVGQADSISGVDGDLIQSDFDFSSDPGDNAFFTLTWTINGNDASTACGANAADSVVVALLTTPAGTLPDQSFACTDGGGLTDPLPLGSYTLGLSAEDTGGNVLSNTDPVDTSLDFGDELVDIGNVDFLIN